MSYSTIDGDISDFFDANVKLTREFSSDQLRSYLSAIGHSQSEVDVALGVWQQDRFQRADNDRTMFRLTPAGLAVVKALRARRDEP